MVLSDIDRASSKCQRHAERLSAGTHLGLGITRLTGAVVSSSLGCGTEVRRAKELPGGAVEPGAVPLRA